MAEKDSLHISTQSNKVLSRSVTRTVFFIPHSPCREQDYPVRVRFFIPSRGVETP